MPAMIDNFEIKKPYQRDGDPVPKDVYVRLSLIFIDEQEAHIFSEKLLSLIIEHNNVDGALNAPR